MTLLRRWAACSACLVLSAFSADAAIINVTSPANGLENASSDVGTLTTSISALMDGDPIPSATYTINALDIDGDMDFSDSLVITLNFAHTEGTGGVPEINLQTNNSGPQGFRFGPNLNAFDETFTFTLDSVTGTTSSGAAVTLDSFLFTGLGLSAIQGSQQESHSLSTNVGTPDEETSVNIPGNGNNTDVTTLFMNQGTDLRVNVGPAGAMDENISNFNVDNFEFRVEVSAQVIPEPTTLALLGLGSLGLVTRRRK